MCSAFGNKAPFYASMFGMPLEKSLAMLAHVDYAQAEAALYPHVTQWPNNWPKSKMFMGLDLASGKSAGWPIPTPEKVLTSFKENKK